MIVPVVLVPQPPTVRQPTVRQPTVKQPVGKHTKAATDQPTGVKPTKPVVGKKKAPAPPVQSVPAPSGTAATVVSFALAQVGKRYVYATAGPNTYDCSGLVMAAYARVGIKLPHQSEQIAARGRRVPAGQWLPGDVIHTSGHVAIYLGNGMMVEAANPGAGIRVAPARGGTAYRFL